MRQVIAANGEASADAGSDLPRLVNDIAKSKLRTLTGEELLKRTFPPRPWILEPVIPGRGLTMLYAPRGIGKTWLALSIAYAAAGGGSLFEWKPGEATPVLYIDGEMPAGVLQQRFAAIVAGFPSEPPGDAVRFLCADAHEDGLPDLRDPSMQEAVEELCGK